MGILRRLREWREDKDGTLIGPDIEADSVNTDDLDIGGADLVQNGDFFPMYTFNPNSTRAESFSATSWANNLRLSQVWVKWDKLFPTDSETAVMAQINLQGVGTGESVDIRLRNATDNETVVSKTGLTSTQMVTLGPTTYTPTTTSAKCQFRLEWQESPGDNNSFIETPFTSLGVQL